MFNAIVIEKDDVGYRAALVTVRRAITAGGCAGAG